MSSFDSKANYHPVSQLAGNLTNGSYLLPGNEYYSVEGQAPRLQFEHNSKIDDSRHRYTQSHRIDALHSLLELKKGLPTFFWVNLKAISTTVFLLLFDRQGTTLTRYHHHNPGAENCRDRYVFVPKYIPRAEPNELLHNPALNDFKQVSI